jgi:cytochrome c556
MNILKTIGAFAVLCCLPLVPLSAAEHHGHESTKELTSTGTNPLTEEMVKLDKVFHEVVSGVALGDGDRVQKAVESMHGTMEKTHEGVHHDTVRLPKNADRMEDFVRQDMQFHGDLEKLATAAGKNDRDEMLRLAKKLLDQCVACHREFRNH